MVIETGGRDPIQPGLGSAEMQSTALPRRLDGPLRKAETVQRGIEKEDCIRVIIVDSCSLGAVGIGEILRWRWKDIRVSHARSWTEIEALLLAGPWDLVLVELDLAGQSGLELVIQARSASPGLRVLAMSSGEESVHGLQALRAGSAGFFHRSGSTEEFLKSVEQVLAGRRYVSRRLAEALADSVDMQRPGWEELDRVLSPREVQILKALVLGESIKSIGRRLEISPKTVSAYRRRILEKLHFRNDADIVKYCWAKGGGALRP